ncbi:MAG: right-handed parallel beta-helix repeat-containing protein, partial [Candidatus Dadabacteria bacterium]
MLLPAPATSAVWSVTSTADPDPAWPGSLRYAFEQAATASSNTWIDLTPVAGQTIALAKALPVIAQPVTTAAISVTGAGATLDGSMLLFGSGIAGTSIGWLAIRDLTVQNFPENGLTFAGTLTGGLLSNVSSVNNGGSGIRLSGGAIRNLTIDGGGAASLSGNGDDGVTFLNQTSGHVVANLTIDNNITNGVLAGDRVHNIQIRDCQINNNIQTGAHLTNGATSVTLGPANVVDNNTLGGVIVEGSSTSQIFVTDNTSINGNVADGVRIVDTGSDIWIYGTSQIANNSGQGVSVELAAVNVHIENTGLIQNNGGSGIRAAGSVAGLNIHGNTVLNNGSARAIELLTGITGARLGRPGRGNTISGNSWCVYIAGANDTELSSNLISGCTNGLALIGANNVLLTGGDVFTANYNAIDASSGSGLFVTSTSFTSQSGDAIKIGGSFGGNIAIGPGATLIANGSSGNAQIRILSSAAAVIVTDSTLNGMNSSGTGIDASPAASGSLLVYNSTIENHTGSGITLNGDAPVAIAASAIHNNGVGIVADLASSVSITNNGNLACSGSDGIYANAAAGIQLIGSTATVSGNCLRDNGSYGVFATLHDAGTPGELVASGDALGHLTLRGNGFASNATGSVLILESYLDNGSEVISGTDGNDFVEPATSTTQFSLSWRWYGLVEVVTSDLQRTTQPGSCTWPGLPTGLTATTSLAAGLCPGGADPDNYLTWHQVEQIGIDTAGNLTNHFAPGSEEQIQVDIGGQTLTGQLVWDGCDDPATDLDAAPSPYNQTVGAPSVCGGNAGARFQAARLIWYPSPQVRFMNSDYSKAPGAMGTRSGAPPGIGRRHCR